MLAEGKVGAPTSAEGATRELTLDKTAGLRISSQNGRYYDSAKRGRIFHAGVAAGVAPAVLGTTPGLALWNPPSSGKDLVVIATTFGYVSGTLGAGNYGYGSSAQITVPSGGTELTPRSSLLSGARGTGRAFTGSTITTAPSFHRSAGASIFQNTAGSAITPCILKDEVNGEIVVPPGMLLAIDLTAAIGGSSSSPLVSLGISWEEVDA